ncbi:hypothetical protein [Halovibrio salipaludis]|nr:hypothetical protein [Halovibrio salipaludis]
MDAFTRCRLGLAVEGQQFFRHEDLLDKHAVQDAITTSAYPLALWFTANWWRLRWEPALNNNELPAAHDWKMSHLMGAAGGGYEWPNLAFASDGESLLLKLRPTRETSGSVRYIERLDTWVSADEFETGVDRFVEQTLEQLNRSTKQNTSLHELWQTLRDERANTWIAAQRQLEARLGYDPEEAPEALLKLLTGLFEKHGETAIQELACVGAEAIEGTIKDVQEHLARTKDAIKLPILSTRAMASALSNNKPGYPWEQGQTAAHETRRYLGIDKGPLLNRRFSEILEAPSQLLDHNESTHLPPIGIAEVRENGSNAKVSLGKKRKEARRFMSARLIADGIYAGKAGSWLPCTNASTVRQKFQRAFAQEFLCPYKDLIEWMNTTSPDDETMEAAADHFDVSPLLVNTVMVNHDHRPRSELEAYQQAI